GLIALTVLLCAGCAATVPPPAAPTAPKPKPELGSWGVDLSGMDTSVKPGDNFFSYVNGNWFKTAEIPADRSSTGSFQTLAILSEKRMRAIMDELKAKPADQLSPDERKMADFFAAYTDRAQIDAQGLAPVKADLDYLAGLKTKTDVAKTMGSERLGTESLFGLYIGVDDKHPERYSVNLSQSGLGMPDRDFYLSDDKNLATSRLAYKKYLTEMLTLAGYKDAAARAARIYTLEEQIAKVHWARADRRDPDKTYNAMTVSALKKLAPGFEWDAFLSEAGIALTSPKGERTVIVAEKSAFPKLAQIFAKTPVAVWRDYLTVHYLHSYAAALPEKFDDADFAFYGTVLRGSTKQLDRETRGVHLIDGSMGEALGKIYVAKYFPPEAKAKAQELVANLLKAYDADIHTLSWMSDATKAKALEKLHSFTPKIGYPNTWRDYSALQISRTDLIGDIQRSNEFDWNRNVSRLDQPVDKTEWGMTPPTINAYYNPVFNEIVFPAAILQPPFFDPNADDAVNYGGIGAVIGHEISHGFDDQGAKYTGAGVLESWWTPEDSKNFTQRTDMVVKQYSAFEPVAGLHIDGKNTLGENIADNAGLTIADKAYKLSLAGKPAPVVDGFTGEQRFLLGFGQIWRSKYRESAKRTQVLTDPHSAAEFRVIGATRNLDDWYEAFGVKAGDKYYLPPEERAKLW
ncbi:MAG: M13 family metallopeptidase, partial [Rhizomicrobium sp.]